MDGRLHGLEVEAVRVPRDHNAQLRRQAPVATLRERPLPGARYRSTDDRVRAHALRRHRVSGGHRGRGLRQGVPDRPRRPRRVPVGCRRGVGLNRNPMGWSRAPFPPLPDASKGFSVRPGFSGAGALFPAHVLHSRNQAPAELSRRLRTLWLLRGERASRVPGNSSPASVRELPSTAHKHRRTP